jgi:hypothetical protein
MLEHEKPWDPLSVADIAALFDNADFLWWVAGGFAIELALGNSIRQHTDIDILILREDHIKVRKWLSQWDCWAADPPGMLRPWTIDEPLDPSIRDIWCRRPSDSDWRFQLMLDDCIDKHWVSHNDSNIRVSLDDVTRRSVSGVPYLAPHIQLYYKAKRPRVKDDIDLRASLAYLSVTEFKWLTRAITLSYGSNHAWLSLLTKAPS